MAARAVESDHVERAKSLVQRVETDQRLELTGGLRLASDREHRFESRLECFEPHALEPGDLGLCERLGRQIGECRPTPQCDGACECRLGFGERLRAKLGSAFGQEPLELVHVEIAGSDAEDIARRFRGERAVVAEEPAELRDVDLHAVGGGCGGIVAPERIDEAIARYDAISLEEQQREHAALLETTEWNDARVVDHFEWSEDSELDQRPPLSTTREP